MRRVLLLFAGLSLLAAACTSAEESPATSGVPATTVTPSSTTSSPQTPATSIPPVATTTAAPPSATFPTTEAPSLPVASARFGPGLTAVPLIEGGTYPGPSWPTSLDGVAYAGAVPAPLRARLVADGFVIEPNTASYDPADGVDALSYATQFSSIYEQLSPYGERAVFVTTDAAYHVWHQVFDKILRDAEQRELLPVLERMVGSLVRLARLQADTLSGSVLADAARRASDHVEAVATLLDLEIGPISQRAAAEVALAEAHTDVAASPTIGGACLGPVPTASCIDYSLLTPRGHYTRTEDLTRFFKAMALLGNAGFSVTDTETFRVGLLIASLLVRDPNVARDWERIYYPTAFLAGGADDYTPFEAQAVAESLAEGGLSDASVLEDDSLIRAVADGLLALRDVQIDPARASLRTMGTRFVLDSWIYDRLTDPGVPGRVEPSPVDVAAVLGSEWALGVQRASGETGRFPDYEERVLEVRRLVAARTIDDWGATVYDAWLYSLESLWAAGYADAYPPFMRTDAWKAKAHNTGFGSYAELRHDTILYAKQGIAEGDAPEPPPPPRHWVEPDPVAFSRLAAAAALLRDGLAGAGLMLGAPVIDVEDDRDTARWLLDELISILDRLAAIAADELADRPISVTDNEWLAYIGTRLSWLVTTALDFEIEPSPLVADIFLNPFDDAVLEIATGPLDRIHVLVPDDHGNFQVATGAVYSYYEFWGPRPQRLTDEEWWDRIIAGDLPGRPAWWIDELG